MKIIRKYLTSAELQFIISEMEKKDTLLEREIVKVGIVAQLCIDEFQTIEDGIDCNDIYDKIVSNEENILDKLEYEIYNYYIIDKMVTDEQSIKGIIESLSNKVETYMNKLDNEELSKGLEALKGMIEDGKDKGNLQ